MSNTQIFKNAVLIDGISDTPLKDAIVIVEDSTIRDAVTKEDLQTKIKPDADVFDLQGMTLMPGLIDTHIHLSLDGTPNYFNLMIMETPALAAIRAVPKVRRIVESGFTTIRTMGDKGQIDIAIKTAINEGSIPGPGIQTSGNCLTITGGHGDMFPAHVYVEGMARIVDGPVEAKKAAREQLKAGADNIKLMATGGGMSPGPGTVPQLTIEEMRAAVEEAEKYGKTTAAHAIGTEGINNALKAGVRTIEHGTFLDEESIALLLEKDAYLVPTLSAFKTLKFGREGGVPEYTIEKVEYYKTAHMKNLRKAIDAGVSVIVGTDAGTPFNYHGESAYELECLVENGLSPMQAIQSATRIAAEALKLVDTGVIKAGAMADLIVVNGDPLKNIKVLQDPEKIKMVVRGGNLISQKSGA